MSDWHIFQWAMLHSAEFKACRIMLPVTVGCRWGRDYPGWSLTFKVYFQQPEFYVPWVIKAAFYAAHNDDAALSAEFDDIPF